MPLEGADLERAIQLGVEKNARLTDEQRDTNKAKFTALMTDKDKLANVMEESKGRFEAADTDGDGRLNEAEWQAYAEKETSHAADQGWQVAPWDETAVAASLEAYGLLNKITDDTEGISWDDLIWNMQNVGAKAHAKSMGLEEK